MTTTDDDAQQRPAESEGRARAGRIYLATTTRARPDDDGGAPRLAVDGAFEDELLLRLQLVHALLDRALRHKARRDDLARLADAVRALHRLVLDRRVPPRLPGTEDDGDDEARQGTARAPPRHPPPPRTTSTTTKTTPTAAVKNERDKEDDEGARGERPGAMTRAEVTGSFERFASND